MRTRAVAAVVAALLGGGALLVASRWPPGGASPTEMSRLRATRDRLREEAEKAFLAGRPVSEIEKQGGSVGLAVSNRFLEGLVKRVVPSYLSRVTLDLRGVEADDEGELHADTFLGDMDLGSWKVHLVLWEARGRLRAGTPELSFTDGRVGITQPFDLEKGHVRGRLVFHWDSSGLTNVVCHDFDKEIEVEGEARPRHYEASGGFEVSGEDGVLSLRPDFPHPRFRLLPDATADTWRRARAALESEDGLFHCGLALDPADVIRRLRKVVSRGFEITLPDRLFSPVRWPAHLGHTLEVGGRTLHLSVASARVSVGPRFLVYGAAVGVERTAPAASGPQERGSRKTVGPAGIS